MEQSKRRRGRLVVNRVVRVSLLRKVTFDQKLEGDRRTNMWISEGRVFQTEGSIFANALVKECVCHV